MEYEEYKECELHTKHGYLKFSEPYIQSKIKELDAISDKYIKDNGKLTTQFYIDQFSMFNEKYGDREFVLTLIRCEYGMNRECYESVPLEYDDDLWEDFVENEDRYQKLSHLF